jgi:hypothetical protein
MKHLRNIRLEPWQQAIVVDREPAALLRGLISLRRLPRPESSERDRLSRATTSLTGQRRYARSSRPPGLGSGLNRGRTIATTSQLLAAGPCRFWTDSSDRRHSIGPSLAPECQGRRREAM